MQMLYDHMVIDRLLSRTAVPFCLIEKSCGMVVLVMEKTNLFLKQYHNQYHYRTFDLNTSNCTGRGAATVTI